MVTLILIAAVGVVAIMLLKPKASTGYQPAAPPQAGLSDAEAMWGGLGTIAGYLGAAGASLGSDYMWTHQGPPPSPPPAE